MKPQNQKRYFPVKYNKKYIVALNKERDRDMQIEDMKKSKDKPTKNVFIIKKQT